MIIQYKSHILPLLEQNTGAIFHANSGQLNRIDALQLHFLDNINLTETAASLDFNLAPLPLRRNIAILGLLYKLSLNTCHADFQQLFPRASPNNYHITHNLRAPRHHLQLTDPLDDTHGDLLHRSIFGMVKEFNRLPQHMLHDEPSVSTFQSRLTEHARTLAHAHHWQHAYTCRSLY